MGCASTTLDAALARPFASPGCDSASHTSAEASDTAASAAARNGIAKLEINTQSAAVRHSHPVRANTPPSAGPRIAPRLDAVPSHAIPRLRSRSVVESATHAADAG